MVRNRDVILNADYVKNLANSLAGAPNSTTTPGVEVAKLIIGNEFDNINNLFQKYSASVIYHLIVRSRIEYLLYSLQHLFPRVSNLKKHHLIYLYIYLFNLAICIPDHRN